MVMEEKNILEDQLYVNSETQVININIKNG